MAKGLNEEQMSAFKRRCVNCTKSITLLEIVTEMRNAGATPAQIAEIKERAKFSKIAPKQSNITLTWPATRPSKNGLFLLIPIKEDDVPKSYFDGTTIVIKK